MIPANIIISEKFINVSLCLLNQRQYDLIIIVDSNLKFYKVYDTSEATAQLFISEKHKYLDINAYVL